MKNTFVLWHLGVGDAIVCNGLIRELVKRGHTLTVPAYAHNVVSVTHMFSDLTKVSVVMVSSDKQAIEMSRHASTVLKLGAFADKGFLHETWDESFYDQAKVDWAKRYSSFKIPPCRQRPAPSGPYAFIHEEHGKGRAITKQRPTIPCVMPTTGSRNIFEWMLTLARATEIHVIDSAFACLADSMELSAKVKVLHKYSRASIPPKLRDGWKILS